MKEKEFIEFIQKTMADAADVKKSENHVENAFLGMDNEKRAAKWRKTFEGIKTELTTEQEHEMINMLPDEDKRTINRRAIDQLTVNLRGKVNLNGVTTWAEVREKAKAVMSVEEFDKKYPLKKYMISSEFSKNADKLLPFVAKSIPEEKRTEIAETINNFVPLIDRKKEDITKQKFENELPELREGAKNLPNKDEINKALDYMETIKVVKEENKFANDLDDRRKEIEAGILHHAQGIQKRDREKFMLDNGIVDLDGNDELIKNVTVPGTDHTHVKVVAEPQVLNKLENSDFKFSKQTKDNLRKLYNKMDEYGLIEGKMVGEEGTKVYGYSKLNIAGENLEKAVQDKNYDDIVKYSNEYKQDTEHLNEILGMIEDTMPVNDRDNLAYPGNVDIARSGQFDIDFRNKIGASSQLSGLHSTFNYLKVHNISLDEYLENPRKAIVKGMDQLHEKELDLDTSTKGKSPAQSILQLSKTILGRNVAGVVMTYPRLMEAAQSFENDKKTREANYYVSRDFNDTDYAKFDSQNTMLMDLHAKDKELFKNILITDGKMSPSQLVTTATYDVKTMQLKEPAKFDRGEYIAKTEIDFKDFKNKMDKAMLDYFTEYKNAGASGMSHGLSRKAFANMTQQLAAEVCMQKSYLKGDPDYEQVMDFVQHPAEYVNNLVKDNPELGLNFNANDFDELNNIERHVEKYIKDHKNFGNDIRNADKNLNTSLLRAAKDYNTATKKGHGADANTAKGKLFEDVRKRKEQLDKEFREGKITESYYNARKEQLDVDKIIDTVKKNGKLPDVPKMFVADKFPSKKEYIKSTGLEELTKDEENVLYEQAKNKAEIEKKDFLTRKFFEDKKIIDGKRPKYTMQEMDEAIQEAEAKNPEKENVVNKKAFSYIRQEEKINEPEKEQIHIDLDEDEKDLEVNEMVKGNDKHLEKNQSKDK